MIEIIGIILGSIVAVILIMALIGYFMEKKQNKVKNNSTTISNAVVNNVASVSNGATNDEIKKNENSVTNAAIPEVLNFNDISDDLEKKENASVTITDDMAK